MRDRLIRKAANLGWSVLAVALGYFVFDGILALGWFL